jgi:hypothetical protein
MLMRLPESQPVQAPTFQISRADHYVANMVAVDMDKVSMEGLTPIRALEAISSILFQPGPDNGIEFRPSAIGLHRQVIAEGYVGNEADQPDAVMTFLGTMVTKKFVVEVMRDPRWSDRFKRHPRILYSYAFGEPPPTMRRP